MATQINANPEERENELQQQSIVPQQTSNSPPVAQNDIYTVASGEPLNVDVASGVLTNDTDSEGDRLVAAIVDNPDSGSYTFSSDGSFTYTSLDRFSGTDSFSYTVSDGEFTSAPATVQINVVPGNNTSPVAQNDIYTTAANQPLNVDVASGVLANDTDAEGDRLNATVVDNPTNGSYTFTSDGSFIYTPLEGFNGTDSFTYTVSDGILTSDPATVQINVGEVSENEPEENAAPIAQNDIYTIAANQPLNVDVASGLLANDTDANQGDRLSATIGDAPDSGSLTFSSDGSFIYTPLEGFNGTDSFTYTIDDGTLTSEPATVQINVGTLTNTAPVAQNDIYTTPTGEALTVDVASGVLANDTDAEGNRLNATVIENPTNGSYTFSSEGSFTYTPLEGFNGTDSFTYTVSDGELTSAPATVQINVGEVSELEPPESENGEIVNIVFDSNEDNTLNSLIFDTTPTNAGTDIVARLIDDISDLGTEAGFDNLIGFYEIADANGSIDTNGDGIGDILPGQEGYALAAIENRIDNFVVEAGGFGDEDDNTSVEEFGSVILDGGTLYSPFIIANGGDLGFDGFVDSEGGEGNAFNNPAEFREDPVAYFGFTAANPDGVSHLQARGNNIFGFEDLPANLGESDNDFNDAVFGFEFSL
ncbi:MAG: Ig-like domain-containing protein [Cyanobacteria bacterium P01_C01_bin.38]